MQTFWRTWRLLHVTLNTNEYKSYVASILPHTGFCLLHLKGGSVDDAATVYLKQTASFEIMLLAYYGGYSIVSLLLCRFVTWYRHN